MSFTGTMPERRLPEVIAHIDADYAALIQGGEVYQNYGQGVFARHYANRGHYHQYSWSESRTGTQELLHANGLSVLDVGCGAGGVVRAYNQRKPGVNKAYGITANTYGETDPALFVGNVHYFDTCYPAEIGPVDVVMSNLMFLHLADPLSVLNSMANQVKRGGLMAVDGFHIRADLGSKVASEVLKYLVEGRHFKLLGRNAGRVTSRYIKDVRAADYGASDAMPEMLLKRTSRTGRPLDLPVGYAIDEESGNWEYVVG